ncbi:uncharacterized protein LOC132534361 [Erinaceus europaeus]|uniref:Uncharacterized protein LOC132534361 n=1 Tax=Erinaceus europaeus TaxID=9365 RepID=A0ABM3WCG2_ERIEU|nr:uncharacterized protein LOC132534361 [Erinaceus europaeus]
MGEDQRVSEEIQKDCFSNPGQSRRKEEERGRRGGGRLGGGGVRRREVGEGRKRKKHGACELYVQNPQGIAVNSFLFEENLQLGNRPFYDLFAVVIGCGWSCAGAARLHGLFPDFPGEFPPAFCLPPASPPLFLTFVSAEVGSSSRLQDRGGPRPLRLPPSAQLGSFAARLRLRPGRPGAGGEQGRWRSPEGAADSRASAGADTRAGPARRPPPTRPGPGARGARSPAAPDGLQQPPGQTAASSLAASRSRMLRAGFCALSPRMRKLEFGSGPGRRVSLTLWGLHLP